MSEKETEAVVTPLEKNVLNSDVEDVRIVYSDSSPKPLRLVLMKNLADDVELQEACQLINLPVSIENELQTEHSDDNVLSIYVLNSFDGVQCNGKNYRIIGRTALLELIKRKKEIDCLRSMFVNLSKPLYCHAFSGLVICFTGFKKLDYLLSLKQMVDRMGGKVRKDINAEVTHLVAQSCKGDKYSYAVLFLVPVLSEKWILDSWENRNIVDFNAADKDYVSKYRLKIFFGCKVCFLGFPEEEKNHMIEVLKENGGEPTDLCDSACTHLVVDDTKISVSPPLKSNKTFVVRAEWFWSSIQYEFRKNELEFKFEKHNQQVNGNVTPISFHSNSLCGTSSGRRRKRKRLLDQSIQKRRSSASDVTRLSLSESSYLSYTITPDTIDDAESPVQEKSRSTTRYHKFVELCQTETNYVKILKTIMTLFKADLEEKLDTKDQLLNATEMKIIFGHLPPIYVTHCSMLKELNEMSINWNEESSIGNLILKYSADLVKTYPPFINFFENARDMLNKCDKTKPRFHAFLKLCQSKPECGRQSLQDLLIRPVQRLPSINLLLNDILRYTPKNSVDYKALEAAIISIQEVMTHINEDKRRTEGQVALFEIFNDIENCPAYLVSSHRCFISRCEVTELSDNLSGKGNYLVLFLFSDVIEVCKKRTKAFHKENGTLNSKHGNMKLYKHIKLLPLSAILQVIDIRETEEYCKSFALMVKSYQEIKEHKEKIYSFTITDTSVGKVEYLRLLCSQIANVVCRTDTESFLTYSEAHKLNISFNEVGTTGTLSKAFNKFASKTRKVGRALSFNKTPSKKILSTP